MKKCDKNIVKPCLYDEKCKFARKAPCRIKLTAGQKMQVAQTDGRTKRGTLCKLHILTKNEKFCLTAGLAGVTMWANQNHGNGAGQVHPARRFCYLSIWGNTAQFPPCGLSTAPAAAARHLRCQNAR
ncbi:MAG: hypothetical protein ACLRX3_13165 [Subdoligranulum sp.]